MAFCVRANPTLKAAAPVRRVQRAAVRPVAALKQQQVAKVAGVAGLALAAGFAAAPVSSSLLSPPAARERGIGCNSTHKVIHEPANTASAGTQGHSKECSVVCCNKGYAEQAVISIT